MAVNADRNLVSLVVPVRNEEAYLARCLDSILAQDYPRKYLEVLVVEGASTDQSRKIIEKYVARYPFIRMIVNPDKTTPISMNIGIRSALGLTIIVLGAHAYIANDFISQSIASLERTGADCVGGRVETVNSSNTFLSRAVALIFSSPFGVSDAFFRYSDREQYVDTVAYGAYRKSVFVKVGLFDEELIRNQDIEFNARIRKAGSKIFYTPNIRSFLFSRPSLLKMIQQSFGNGFWNVRTILHNRSALSLRHFIPLLFVMVLLGCLGLSFFWLWPLWFLLLTLASYFILAIYFSLPLASKNGWHYLPVMPFVFFIFHFSYGFGTMLALLKAVLKSC